jgi:hypothetical protein
MLVGALTRTQGAAGQVGELRSSLISIVNGCSAARRVHEARRCSG